MIILQIQTLDHEETHPETEESTFVTEATQNELDLAQQDLNPTSMMSQPDLSQQSILSQASLQDALGLGTGMELQQINQQVGERVRLALLFITGIRLKWLIGRVLD